MRRAIALLCTVGLALTACQSGSSGSADKHAAAHGSAHWSYTGEAGPSHWASLSPDNAACSEGDCQSPVDVTSPQPKDLPNLVFDYKPSAINIINNGHTVQVNYDPGSFIVLDGKQYALAQFHFHAPSEHHINGRPFAAELHLVHKASDGELAVVGVLITSGRENPAFASVWSSLPPTAGPAHLVPGRVNAAEMLPVSRLSYRYGGSLTTPPCTQGVKWTVMTTPIEMSAAQISAFARLHAGNNRPIQPLNARVIVEDTTP